MNARRIPPKPWTPMGWKVVGRKGPLLYQIALPCNQTSAAVAEIYRAAPGKPWRWRISETESTSKYFTAAAAAASCEIALRAALRQSLLMLTPGALRR